MMEKILASPQFHNNRYIPPHPLLRPYIAHYTVSGPEDPGHAGDTLTIIPDASGCLTFKLADGRWSGDFWGPTTRTVDVQRFTEGLETRVFVEFRPCGGYFLTGQPLNELRDRMVAVEAVNPALARGLYAVLEQARTEAELRQGLDGFFLGCLAKAEQALSGLPLGILEEIQRSGGAIPVKELSARTFYSPRHLNRLLSTSLGMGVKGYERLLRVNRALLRIQARPVSLTMLAQELGYCDQSHFIHDFKAVCGASPAAYREKMSDFYNEVFKF